jgi:hypothetical protein
VSAPSSGKRYNVRVGGDVSGQLATGENINQMNVTRDAPAPVTEADLAEVRRLVDELKRKIAAEAPPEQRDPALERVDELHNAIVADKPDVTTMDSCSNRGEAASTH